MRDVHLYLAPAAAGKTAYVLDLVREAAAGLAAVPWVVVASGLQVDSWCRRLAEGGGAIGVHVETFERLYRVILNAAGEVYTEIGDAMQYYLVRSLVKAGDLRHYSALVGRPGFIRLLRQMIGELKAGRILPEALVGGIKAMGSPPRLMELAEIYDAYQTRLQAERWADSAGLGWLAVNALEQRATELGRNWPLLIIDGFDNLTPVQLAVLEILADRTHKMIVTMTGDQGGTEERLVHRRFAEARSRLERALGIKGEPLPKQVCTHAPALAHLERGLYSRTGLKEEGAGAIEMIEAPDRAGEVRAALRWLKACLVDDGLRPGDVGLLARNLQPYREAIRQVAVEFELPVVLMEGQQLRRNPAVAALLDLTQLLLPGSAENSEPRLPRRGVVEAWRSPYFDWRDRSETGGTEGMGICPGDADTLDRVARWGRVIGGHSQWEEVLDDLVKSTGVREVEDEEQGMPPGLPRGETALELREKFGAFVRRMQPPGGRQPIPAFVEWLEDLIGQEDQEEGDGRMNPGADRPDPGLRMMARIGEGSLETKERDRAALRAFREVLRGLVWTYRALGSRLIDYPGFYQELMGAVEASTFQSHSGARGGSILAADAPRARGVPLKAVAILGLAEGEFPAKLSEDPFLRDADRRRLRENSGLLLELSTDSAEAEFFYEALTRGRDRVLLTRPRMDDNGAVWQASPFWEEVVRLVDVVPTTMVSESVPWPSEAASWPELIESLAVWEGDAAAWRWVAEKEPVRQMALEHAVQVFQIRDRDVAGGAYDGDLSILAAELMVAFGPGSVWSASRFESYRACPFQFLVSSLWELAPREEPTEGLDARQLGNIYHRILEAIYRSLDIQDPTDTGQLLAVSTGVAEKILDRAPMEEGFRETAWWRQTRAEILRNVQRTLEALGALPGDLVPLAYEVAFGFRGAPPLVVRDGEDSFNLRGLIDRVDRSPDGGLCVIDYKTGSPAGFDNRAIADGKKLQLPFYALAARDALGLGDPVDGFYWHVRHAEASRFTLADFPGGPAGAIEVAIEKAWEAIDGARRGLFVPSPPDDGCPSYCPAAAFCWRWRPGWGGRR